MTLSPSWGLRFGASSTERTAGLAIGHHSLLVGQANYWRLLRRGQHSIDNAVVKVHNAVAKSPLTEQLEPSAILARQSRLSTTHHNRIEKEMALVDQPCTKCERCQLGTSNGQIIFR